MSCGKFRSPNRQLTHYINLFYTDRHDLQLSHQHLCPMKMVVPVLLISPPMQARATATVWNGR